LKKVWQLPCRKQHQGPPSHPRCDGAFETRLIILACSQAPPERCHWTVRLLADKAVERCLADKLSHMTVQRLLKKNDLRPHLKKYWRMASTANATFVVCTVTQRLFPAP
jgi:hypothetical protein